MSSCSNCGKDMRHGVALPATDATLAFQERADRVVLTGVGSYRCHQLQAKDWFHLARYFLMLLRCAARRHVSGLGNCLTRLDPGVVRLRPPVTGLGLEMLPQSERSDFLQSVGALIQAGPEQLRDAVVSDSMKDTSLRQGWPSLPTHIDAIVREIPHLVRSRRTKGNKSLLPMSRRTVLYNWARLQRRVRRVS